MKISSDKLKNLTILNKIGDYNLDDRYVGDNLGNVYLTTDDKGEYNQMSPYENRDGYVEYVLTNKDSVKKHIMGHIVCAGLWVPGWKKGYEVNHKDGVRNNIKYSNLEWETHADNVQHSYDELRPKKK